MNNDNGFTIIELLVVILLISVLMVLVVPTITNPSSKTKEKAYDTKVSMILSASKLYAQDNYSALVSSGSGTSVKVNDVCVYTLIPDYLVPETKVSKKQIPDPRDGTKYLDRDIVRIKITTENRKIEVEYNPSGSTKNCNS